MNTFLEHIINYCTENILNITSTGSLAIAVLSIAVMAILILLRVKPKLEILLFTISGTIAYLICGTGKIILNDINADTQDFIKYIFVIPAILVLNIPIIISIISKRNE